MKDVVITKEDMASRTEKKSSQELSGLLGVDETPFEAKDYSLEEVHQLVQNRIGLYTDDTAPRIKKPGIEEFAELRQLHKTTASIMQRRLELEEQKRREEEERKRLEDESQSDAGVSANDVANMLMKMSTKKAPPDAFQRS